MSYDKRVRFISWMCHSWILRSRLHVTSAGSEDGSSGTNESGHDAHTIASVSDILGITMRDSCSLGFSLAALPSPNNNNMRPWSMRPYVQAAEEGRKLEEGNHYDRFGFATGRNEDNGADVASPQLLPDGMPGTLTMMSAHSTTGPMYGRNVIPPGAQF